MKIVKGKAKINEADGKVTGGKPIGRERREELVRIRPSIDRRMEEIRDLCRPDLDRYSKEYVEKAGKGMSKKEREALRSAYTEGIVRILEAVQRYQGWYEAIAVVKMASNDVEWLNDMGRMKAEMEGADGRSFSLRETDHRDAAFQREHGLRSGEDLIDEMDWDRDEFLRHAFQEEIRLCTEAFVESVRKKGRPEENEQMALGHREGMLTMFNAILEAFGNRTLAIVLLEAKSRAGSIREYGAGMENCQVKRKKV